MMNQRPSLDIPGSRRPTGLDRARAAALAAAALGLTLALLPAPAQATSASVKAAPKTWPIGGLVTLGSSVGIGTFVAGEQQRPSVGTSLSMLLNYRPMPGLTLMVNQAINKTFIDNASDPFAPRQRNTSLDDVLLIASWSPMLKDDSVKPKQELSEAKKKALAAAAAVNPTLVTAAGAGKPLTLPGGVRVSFLAIVGLPTSKLSRFQTRWLNLIGAVNFSRSWKYLTLTYQPRFQKQLHRYSYGVVDASASPLALAREGGPEDLGAGMVASNQANISFVVRNALIANVPGPGGLSFQLFYFLMHQYRYEDPPVDALSSVHAKPGRRANDLQFGQVAANYVIGGGWIGSFSINSFSAPWSADNQTLRFPFFDLRSASDNITSLNLSLTRSF